MTGQGQIGCPSPRKGRRRNYRPASLISRPGQIMKQGLKDLEEKEVIRNQRCGSTKGKSSLTDLISFSSTVTGPADVGSALDAPHHDVSPAFDTVV